MLNSHSSEHTPRQNDFIWSGILQYGIGVSLASMEPVKSPNNDVYIDVYSIHIYIYNYLTEC